nr:ISL3 family transposase [Clostridium manihotivorum]
MDKSSVTKVCIDDFAMKKRSTYGTVMIDIETKHIVDILDSRELDNVVEWLKTYPNLEVISRDGAQTYATAIKKAHPKSIQISDRFHILKNLTDYCKNYLTKILSFNVKLQKQTSRNLKQETAYGNTRKLNRINQANILYDKGKSPKEIGLELKMDIRTVNKYLSLDKSELILKENDSPNLNHKENVTKKEKNLNQVRNLHKQGYGIREISRETGISRQTVRRYLDSNACAVHGTFGISKKSPLSPFHSIIDDLLTKGYTFRIIEEHLRLNGYTGSASAIRMYSTRKRRLIKQVIDSNYLKYELIDRKYLIKLLYKPLDKVKAISIEQLEVIGKEYPILSKIYLLVDSFKKILFSKKPNALDTWLEDAKKLNISEINSFIKGLTKDIAAVKNAIMYKYSNGLAEGSVNKIKVIKRIMYGRCTFETIRKKVLSYERLRTFN